jgi:hypothetical protein
MVHLTEIYKILKEEMANLFPDSTAVPIPHI